MDIKHNQITGALGKAAGGDVGKAFRGSQTAATAYAIVFAVAQNLAELASFKPKARKELAELMASGAAPAAPTPAEPAKPAKAAQGEQQGKKKIDWQPGMPAKAPFKEDGLFYKGKIHSINGSKCTFEWDDGTKQLATPLESLKSVGGRPKAAEATA